MGLRNVPTLCLPLFQGCFGSYPSQTTLFLSQLRHDGFVSSHFFFRRLHVPQPVFDLACDAFFCSTRGCFLGLPRLRGVGNVILLATIVFASSIPSSGLSSSSSIFGTTDDDSSLSSLSLSGVTTASTVNSGDELDVVDGYELEKVLRLRARDAESGELIVDCKEGSTSAPDGSSFMAFWLTAGPCELSSFT